MRIYARQVDPDLQKNGFVDGFDEYYANNMIIFKNFQYGNLIREDYREIARIILDGNLADHIKRIISGKDNDFDSVEDAVLDYFNEIELCSSLTDEDRREIAYVVIEEYSYDFNKSFCNILSVITKAEWKYREIQGNYYGQHNTVFYVSSVFSDKDIAEIETLYFNTGSEWIIHDGEKEPESAEDIKGHSFYCSDRDEKRFFCEYFNVPENDVVLYKFDGYKKVTMYSIL